MDRIKILRVLKLSDRLENARNEMKKQFPLTEVYLIVYLFGFIIHLSFLNCFLFGLRKKSPFYLKLSLFGHIFYILLLCTESVARLVERCHQVNKKFSQERLAHRGQSRAAEGTV